MIKNRAGSNGNLREKGVFFFLPLKPMIIVEWGMERASGLIPVLYSTGSRSNQVMVIRAPGRGGVRDLQGLGCLVWSGLGKELKVIDWKQTNFAPACFCGRTVFGEGLSDY